MLISVFVIAALLPGGEPDGVIATAPRMAISLEAGQPQPDAPTVHGAAEQALDPHGLTTDQQIDRWIAARTPDARPFADGDYGADSEYGEASARRMHGMVDVGVGTGGYRSYGAAVSMPLGETGTLNLSFRQVENGFGYGGYGYGYDSYGHGDLGLGRSWINDSGYAFPGYQTPEDALRFERRVARPGGPPWNRPLLQPQQIAPK
ncbi:MAG: hypothetical protein ACRED4_04500 [Brevundimonas sp.]